MCSSRLTPGITRRPERLQEFEKRRVGGRVHAVVMPPVSALMFALKLFWQIPEGQPLYVNLALFRKPVPHLPESGVARFYRLEKLDPV